MSKKLNSDTYLALLNGVNQPILIVNQDQKITFANIAAENFFELSLPMLLKQNMQQVLSFDSPLLQLIDQTFQKQTPINEYDFQFEIPRLKITKIVDVQANLLELSSDQQEPLISLMFVERNMANMFETQILNRNTTKSIANMADILAHEIKNPLSGIRGAAQLLGATATDEDKGLTTLICDETDRICNLIDQMEQFSDGQIPEFEDINIHTIIDHVKKIAENGFGKHVKFIEQYDPSLPNFHANKDQLIQVLLNLIKNACEATQEVKDATIIISTAYKSGVKLKLPNQEKIVAMPFEIIIEDNGPGIEKKLLPNIYDVFVSQKSGGKGLGLALVAKLLADHGAVIDYIGDKRGAKFRILFPHLKN